MSMESRGDWRLGYSLRAIPRRWARPEVARRLANRWRTARFSSAGAEGGTQRFDEVDKEGFDVVELALQPFVDRSSDHHDDELQRLGQHLQPPCPSERVRPSGPFPRFRQNIPSPTILRTLRGLPTLAFTEAFQADQCSVGRIWLRADRLREAREVPSPRTKGGVFSRSAGTLPEAPWSR